MLHIHVVTPEKVLLDDDVDEIIAPTTSGEITILPHHIPLVSQLMPGELIIKKHGREENMIVVGGFLQVNATGVIVLADYATLGKDISASKAEEAKKQAEKAMKEKTTERDFIVAQAEFQKAILELKVANRHRTHSSQN